MVGLLLDDAQSIRLDFFKSCLVVTSWWGKEAADSGEMGGGKENLRRPGYILVTPCSHIETSNRGAFRTQEFPVSMSQTSIEFAAAPTALPVIVDELDGLVDREIRAFIRGDSDGYELLDALYGDVLDEPVPERLTALLRR